MKIRNKTDKRIGQKLKESDIVGKTIGILTVLSLDKILRSTCGKHTGWEYFVTVKCNNCGKTFQTTWKNVRATSRLKCKSCRFCMGTMMIDNRTKNTGFTLQERLRISAIKSCARRRNIPLTISDEEIKSIISKPCVYCGKDNALGIDRIDSEKGYEIDNVVPCCIVCNRMKNNYSLDFFKAHIEKIYKKFYENLRP